MKEDQCYLCDTIAHIQCDKCYRRVCIEHHNSDHHCRPKPNQCCVCNKMAYIECNHCNRQVCVKHRYGTDHQCYPKKEKVNLVKLVDNRNYTQM